MGERVRETGVCPVHGELALLALPRPTEVVSEVPSCSAIADSRLLSSMTVCLSFMLPSFQLPFCPAWRSRGDAPLQRSLHVGDLSLPVLALLQGFEQCHQIRVKEKSF